MDWWLWGIVVGILLLALGIIAFFTVLNTAPEDYYE